MVRSRNWGKSNPFSELHRKNIPGYLCLFDIDGVYISGNSVSGIYEGKYKMYSGDRGNFIDLFDDQSNIQARFLKTLSGKIPVWISEESTNKWWTVRNGNLEECEPNQDTFTDTSDRIYAGYRLSKFNGDSIYSIFHRTLGEKPPKDDEITSGISQIFRTKKILVNDTVKDRIFFKNSSLSGFTEAPITEGSDWTLQWKELGII